MTLNKGYYNFLPEAVKLKSKKIGTAKMLISRCPSYTIFGVVRGSNLSGTDSASRCGCTKSVETDVKRWRESQGAVRCRECSASNLAISNDVKFYMTSMFLARKSNRKGG